MKKHILCNSCCAFAQNDKFWR